MIVTLLLGCVAVLLVLSAFGAAIGKRGEPVVVYGASFAISLVALLIAGSTLILDSQPVETVLPIGLPFLGAHFRIDALSAFFLVIVNLGAAAASLFAIGYGRHEREPSRVLPFYPAYLAGMNLVVLAADAFSFLVSWEFMSLMSWALVMAQHRVAENRRAGYIYLIMASFGTFALLLAFGLMAGPDGGYAFATIREVGRDPMLSSLILALTITGAGSKAGLVPLHVWLPLAHPAAPSHVSALMSGVMTKVAVYAFIRIVFDLVGPIDWWWAAIVLALGSISAVMGMLYALMQDDLKRLLAYCTVENVGIVFIGLGLALAFRANDFPEGAALAMTAALFQIFNHSLLKSLLFFGSGAVLSATDERSMEKLGGLIHRMPYTAFAFLLGSAAISALPPLNGFVSEWMMFQAIFLSPVLPQWGLKLLIPATGAMLALSAALAAACFVKGFGLTFLGRARSKAAAEAKETDGFSLAAMFALASLCAVAGILPGFVIDVLAPVVREFLGQSMAEQAAQPLLTITPQPGSANTYSGAAVFLLIAAAVGLTALAIRAAFGRIIRRSAAWDCGFPDPSTATQYTGASFAQPIRRVFGTMVFHAREHVEMPPPGDMHAARFQVSLRDLVWDILYAPIASGVSLAAQKLNHLQFLTIRRYLLFAFFTLVFLLLVLAIWQ
jgi:formate hydrogenlyase subunit 3/multisubunit Na+/H+ antiporter MnhD subunit